MGSFPFFVHLQPWMIALPEPIFLKKAEEYYGFMWYRPILMPRHSEPDPVNSSLPSVTQNAQQRALSSWHQPVTDVFQTIALPPSPLLVFSNPKAGGKLAYTFHQGIKVCIKRSLIGRSGFVYFEVESCYLAYPDLELCT